MKRASLCVCAAFALDLPAHGSIASPDVNWNVGRVHPTFIYRSVLRFTRR